MVEDRSSVVHVRVSPVVVKPGAQPLTVGCAVNFCLLTPWRLVFLFEPCSVEDFRFIETVCVGCFRGKEGSDGVARGQLAVNGGRCR